MFRLDRFLTLFLFSPLIKRRKELGGCRIPILMYHGISNPKSDGRHPYYETCTSPEVFAQQMEVLSVNGYKVVPLEDVTTIFIKNGECHTRYAVITFDDGLYNFYFNAFPILEKYNFKSTVFIPTGLVGKSIANQNVMTWETAYELSRKGVTFGSHSVTHPQLFSMSMDEVKYEIMASKKMLEKKIKKRITSFSYPYAFPDQGSIFVSELEEMLHKCGYKIGVTTSVGRYRSGDNVMFLKRLPINNYDDIKFLIAKLRGGYDWVYRFQKIKKKAKFNV